MTNISLTTSSSHREFANPQIDGNALYNIGDINFQQNTNKQFHYNLRGTIVPPEWKSISTKEGKKLSRGALELYSIIVSWYNCKKVKDKETGKITLVQKFEGEEFRRNYQYFMDQLGRSQEQVRRYFAELKSASLVEMEIRTVTYKNWRNHYTLCINLNKSAPHLIQYSKVDCNQSIDIIPQLNNEELYFPHLPSHLNDDKMDTTQNNVVLSNIFDGKSKKIRPLPHKKVGTTPQKSGAIYIDKTIFKTNNKSRSNQSNFYENKILDSNNCEKTQPTRFLSLAELVEQNIISRHDERSDSVKIPTQLISPYVNPGVPLKESIGLIRKPMKEYHPLTEEDAIALRKASGRIFALGYINKLLLKIAQEKPENGFYNKDLLISHMTKALIGEERDAESANKTDSKFKVKVGSAEYETRLHENYLNKIESGLETDISSIIKRRIIGLFPANEAYHVLTNCFLTYIPSDASKYKNNKYTVITADSITYTQKSTISEAVCDIIGETTEVIFKDKDGSMTPIKGQASALAYQHTNDLAISSPIWQKIRKCLKSYFGDKGEALDASWFSKVDIDIEKNRDNSKIFIKAPTTFVRDWIKNNFGEAIENVISDLATAKDELFGNVNIEGRGGVWLEWSSAL